ncbi:2-nitropropane dioxygenase [Phyllobacterium brassicacearum]|uniref:2-nitropropane dioxygenase n=1 Tax=Phyllobacterium brassicacearum TaxID=314235 RepID=A0A2P7B450_9HYPH|nr:nitronate monooxygenase [Phyllobacterium brassicacearum]PSH61210.1 2-nitropropane dioxygenase [Phyllobacterium brassicacearum]TDQ12968.1 nitronate monooxygenase [Phyllobacterium brassicacearum]
MDSDGTIVTPFTRLLGIRHPIVSAPMGRASRPELAAAVTNAGGLGGLGFSWDSPAGIEELVIAVRRLSNDGPFLANFVLEWDQHQRMDAALSAGARIVSFCWGDVAPYMDRAKAAGALVVNTVGTPEEARRSVDLGVDVLVAQGNEAGGHVWSRLSSMVLLPLVVDVAGKVPVLAAGGIADGRGLAAALMLGASGVWLGTRFLASTEAACHAEYKRRLIEAAASDTIETTLFDGGWPDAPSRVLRNRTVETWEAAGRPASGSRPGEGEEIGRTPDGSPVRRYSFASLLSGGQGDIDDFVIYAGESVGLVREIRPASDIVRALIDDAAQTMAQRTRHFSDRYTKG